LLKDLKPFKVEVTVYGATQETCERVTRVRGSFRQCMKGIEQLAAALGSSPSTGSGPPAAPSSSKLCLKTMALTLNTHEVKEIERLAEQHGATFRYDPMVMGRIDGKEGPRQVRMRPAEVLAVDMADSRRVREWVKAREQFRGPLRESDRVFQCGGGVNTFFVEAKGRLVMCPVARSWGYDLTRGTFQEGWERARRARQEMKRTRLSPCATCHLAALCGQCPGWGETEHGDPEARVDYLCRIAHLRADYLEKVSPSASERKVSTSRTQG
jgi:radical SAM protein with 4Fe4S-binding SPASM domain